MELGQLKARETSYIHMRTCWKYKLMQSHDGQRGKLSICKHNATYVTRPSNVNNIRLLEFRVSSAIRRTASLVR